MTSGTRFTGTRNFSPPVPFQETTEKVWDGGDDPGKHSRENAYSMSAIRWRRVSVSQPNTYYPYVPPFWYAGTNYDVDFNTVRNRAANGNTELKSLGKVRDAIKGHDFNAAGAFADTEKTLELLVHSVGRCFDFLKAVQRLDVAAVARLIPQVISGGKKLRSNAARALRAGDIPNAWLALQYGWTPLAKDVVAAVEAYKSRHDELRSMKFTAVSRTPRTKVYVGIDTQCPVYADLDEWVRYCITLTEVPSSWRNIAGNAGLTVLWERIPFSFVVDWFIPIGQALEEYQYFAGLGLVYTKTVFQKWLVNQATRQTNWKDGSLYCEAVVLKRTVGTSIGFSVPSLKKWEKAMTSAHTKNAAALIAGFAASFISTEVAAGRRPYNGVVAANVGRVGRWRGVTY